MGTDTHRLIHSLLNLRTWTVFDIDDDGRVLAGHDELGSTQLVEIAPDGGRTPLTQLPTRVAGRYIPGSRAVVVQHDAGGDENFQLSTLEIASAATLPVDADGLTTLVANPAFMHTLHDVTADSVVYSTNRRNGTDMDLVVHDLASGAERVVYDDGGYLVEAVASHAGTTAAVTNLSLQPASTYVTVGGKHVTAVDEHAHHDNIAWTAADDALILASNHERDLTGIARVPLDGGDWEWLVEDEHELTCTVSPDASAMVVGTHVDGTFELAIHEIDGSFRCAISTPLAGVPEIVWAPDASRLAISLSAATDPGSIHLVDAATGESTLLVDALEGIDEEIQDNLVGPTVYRVPTPDGEQIPCFSYAPPYDESCALYGASVLLIHGGPESAAVQAFSPVIQALAAAGLTVLVPNVRGSRLYGKRWYSLDDVDLRLDSVADLAAIHDWLPTRGLDPDRSALWGGSYGGYMVLAGVSMQPQLWAAGVDIVGMSSLVTFLENTSDYRRAYREREYGTLAEDRSFLEKASPLTYLDQIRAPLFVIHGANDPRVPLSEAEQVKAALDGKGVPCELKVYGDEGHGLAKRANRLDAYPQAVDFLSSHLARHSSS